MKNGFLKNDFSIEFFFFFDEKREMVATEKDSGEKKNGQRKRSCPDLRGLFYNILRAGNLIFLFS